MKVLFSNPPWWEEHVEHNGQALWRSGVRAGSRWPWTGWVQSRPGRYVFGDYLPYPFFMGYAASYAARETGADVHFRDSIALRESYDKYFAFVKDGGFDYIFIETSTPSWDIDRLLIEQIHRVSPRTRLVLTGPPVASRGQEILNTLPVHACIKGEYEKGSVRVLNGAGGLLEFDLLTREEMNAAPYPWYDANHARRYWDGCPAGQRRPQAQVWSSRGCPYKCIFCVWPATMTSDDPDGTQRRRVRHYTPEYMEGFLTELVETYRYKTVYFDDDTFNLGDRHTLAMCGVMRKLGVPWAAMCRADTIRLETWAAMKESGCFGVKIGFESGNQWVVDHIVKKRLDLEQAKEVVYELHRLGITVHGTFTYGLPGETREQMADTKRFIQSLPFDSYQESGTATIEGTPLDTLMRQGKLDKYDGAVLSGDFCAVSDGGRRIEDLQRMLSP